MCAPGVVWAVVGYQAKYQQVSEDLFTFTCNGVYEVGGRRTMCHAVGLTIFRSLPIDSLQGSFKSCFPRPVDGNFNIQGGLTQGDQAVPNAPATPGGEHGNNLCSQSDPVPTTASDWDAGYVQ